MEPDQERILQVLSDRQASLRAWGVRRLGLFGSVARGQVRPGSDMDFVVEFESGLKTFDNYMGLKDFLEELFQRRVDLVTSEGLKPQLRDRILSETIYAP